MLRFANEIRRNNEVGAFRYIDEQGYKVVGQPRTSYIDGAWNQDDPEKWLSVIQIPIE